MQQQSFVSGIQVLSYDGHTSNVMALGFQKDGKWMYSGTPVCQLSVEARAWGG